MIKRVVGIICVLVTCFALSSCRKLSEDEFGTGSLAFEEIQDRSHIPAELGKLVAVTSNGARQDLAQLWFEKPDKTIAVAFVDFRKGSMSSFILTIPRK